MRHITPGDGPHSLGRKAGLETGHGTRSHSSGPMERGGGIRHPDKARYKQGGTIGTPNPHRAEGGERGPGSGSKEA